MSRRFRLSRDLNEGQALQFLLEALINTPIPEPKPRSEAELAAIKAREEARAEAERVEALRKKARERMEIDYR